MAAGFSINSFRNGQLNHLLAAIDAWTSSEPLKHLVTEFGGFQNSDNSLTARLEKLAQFSSIWDYRGKLSSGERWHIEADSLPTNQLNALDEVIGQLGLNIQVHPQRGYYDHLLILGGAKSSCLLRTREAMRLLDSGLTVDHLSSLTSMRRISDAERESTDTYAEHAETELDLMLAAVENFDQLTNLQREGDTSNTNSRLHWAKLSGNLYKRRKPTTLLAARSEQPELRNANTGDTYNFFAESLNLKEGMSILIITSPIYVCYQHIDAVRLLGMKYECDIETVSFDPDLITETHGMVSAENYLQEIRSLILSANRLASEVCLGQ